MRLTTNNLLCSILVCVVISRVVLCRLLFWLCFTTISLISEWLLRANGHHTRTGIKLTWAVFCERNVMKWGIFKLNYDWSLRYNFRKTYLLCYRTLATCWGYLTRNWRESKTCLMSNARREPGRRQRAFEEGAGVRSGIRATSKVGPIVGAESSVVRVPVRGMEDGRRAAWTSAAATEAQDRATAVSGCSSLVRRGGSIWGTIGGCRACRLTYKKILIISNHPRDRLRVLFFVGVGEVSAQTRDVEGLMNIGASQTTLRRVRHRSGTYFTVGTNSTLHCQSTVPQCYLGLRHPNFNKTCITECLLWGRFCIQLSFRRVW